MALSDVFSSIFNTVTSPKAEELISAVPQLVGAYESARGKPIGAPLSLLGGWGEQNAETRKNAASLNALQKLVAQQNPTQSPVATAQYGQLQNLLPDMTPEDQRKQLEANQALGTSEAIAYQADKGEKPFYNTKTGSYEYHKLTDFPGGVLPDNLMMPGANASAQYARKHNLPPIEGKPTDTLRLLDTVAKADFGATDFADLQQRDPQKAEQAYVKAKTLVPEATSQITLKREENLADHRDQLQRGLIDYREQVRLARPNDPIAKKIRDFTGLMPEQFRQLPQDKQDATLQQIADMDARYQGTVAAGKAEAIDDEKPQSPLEKDILDIGGVKPGVYRTMSDDDKAKIRNKVYAEKAARDASALGLKTQARMEVAGRMARQNYLEKSIYDTKYFAVDKKNFARVGNPEDTMGDVSKNNWGLVARSEEKQYNQATTALGMIPSILESGKKVLPRTGGVKWLENKGIAAKAQLGDVDAQVYLSQAQNMIPILRTLAGTSRPNKTEIDAAIQSLQNVANSAQLQGVMNQTQNAIQHTLNAMIQNGGTSMYKELTDTSRAAATMAASPGTKPATPGVSSEY